MTAFIALGIYGAFLVCCAVGLCGEFSTWKMFASACDAEFELTDQDGQEFQVWEHLPHSTISFWPEELPTLLDYSRRVLGRTLVGTVIFRLGAKVTVVHVVDGRAQPATT